MDGLVNSGAALEVSVSFGRFENNGLSWEKRSSFSPNKYLEEAGSLSTPGSVAQKKAYFEAHYKKIAAKKAEELEEESSMGPTVPTQDMSRKEDCVLNSSEIDIDFGLSNGVRVADNVSPDACMTLMPNGTIVNEDDDAESPKGDYQGYCCINGSIAVTDLGEKKEDAPVLVKCGSSAVEETKDDINGEEEGGDLYIRKDTQSIGSKTLQKGSQRAAEKPLGRKNGLEQSRVSKKENSKLNARNIPEKVTPSTKDRALLAGRTKKVESPPVKKLQTSVPKYSKPSSAPPRISSFKTLKNQANGSQVLKSKNSLVRESKRAAPTSLHMSMNLGSAKSLAAIPTTRKSFIMENMGEKDIVKRAFKTFQNCTNEYTNDEKLTSVKHMLYASVDMKISASRTPMQKNEGFGKDSEKRATQMSQLETRSYPLTKGSHKKSALDRKNVTTLPPTTGMRTDEKAEKQKEFLKKVEAKSIPREARNTRLIAKLKEKE